VPRLTDYFDRLVDFAVAADWGRRELTRVDMMPPRDLLPVA
jgi:hypothetical protein